MYYNYVTRNVVDTNGDKNDLFTITVVNKLDCQS